MVVVPGSVVVFGFPQPRKFVVQMRAYRITVGFPVLVFGPLNCRLQPFRPPVADATPLKTVEVGGSNQESLLPSGPQATIASWGVLPVTCAGLHVCGTAPGLIVPSLSNRRTTLWATPAWALSAGCA